MTHPRNQDGFALIEVIVSAAVLALIALAVLSGIDGATASTARERARAVAASLAEQDQERLRGYRFEELSRLNEETTRSVGDATYTVKSEAAWVSDAGEVVDETCGAAGAKQSEYLRIVSTVTSKLVGTRIPAVKIESLVSPPVSGSLVVKLEGGVPARVPVGITVTAIAKTTGRTYAVQTNSLGCAVFRTIETGDYTIRLNTPGWVDKKPQQLSEKSATVNSALMSVVTMPYDRAISMRVSVKTLRPGAAFPSSNTYDSKIKTISDSAADVDTRPYSLTAPGSTFDITGAFPFGSAYSFFTGPCGIQSPVKTGNPNYFSVDNTAATILGDPDSVQKPQLATVFQPALNARIRASSSNADPTQSTFDASAFKVYAVLQTGSDTCADFPAVPLQPTTWPSAWGANALNDANKNRNWLVQSGGGFDPGLPFGTYRICIRHDRSSGNRYWSTAGTSANPHYDNTKPAKAATVELPPSGTSTSAWSTAIPTNGCPA